MLSKKLLVRTGSRVAVIGAPADIDLVLPPGAVPSERGLADIVLVYASKRAALGGSLEKAAKRLESGGVLWIAYPKAGKLGTDLNRDVLAGILRGGGLEPVAQIAVDAVWSALRVKSDTALSEKRNARGVFAEKPGAKKKAAPAKKKAAPAKKKAAPAKKKAAPAKKKATKRGR